MQGKDSIHASDGKAGRTPSNVVYFSSFKKAKNMSECLNVLLQRTDKYFSGFKKGSFVGIKMTVGDEGSTGYIRPDIVRVVVENLKARGLKPFVFDTNVIYTGRRQNAVDHLNLAYIKGFTPDNLGCPYIIADSVFGTDSRVIEVDFRNIKEIRVPS
ncbi:MAG TPA: DUF362 domain-containing protein, partial [Nitrospirae bacterium]|nr:DUF362 domain-containing protein [Nitrospirota bacterium]